MSELLCAGCGLPRGAPEANHRGRLGEPMPLSIGPISEDGYFPHPFEPAVDAEVAAARTVAILLDRGLATIEGGELELTEAGWDAVRAVQRESRRPRA